MSVMHSLCNPLETITEDIAERFLRLLTAEDLQSVRLVSKHWYNLTRRFVTTLRPASLSAFLENANAAEFPRVHSVDLKAIDIADDAHLESVARALAKIPLLEGVTLRCGSDVTVRGFDALAFHVPFLRNLNLQPVRNGCVLPERPAFDVMAVKFERFRHLVHLDLSWNRISHDVITSIASLPQLETLNIKNCLDVDDSVIEEISEMHTLRSLNMAGSNVTDDGLMMMNDLELSTLNISKCEGITDDGVYWLQHIRSLNKLDLSSCPQITSAGTEQLINLRHLTHLYLQDVKPIATSFFRKMEQLRVVSLRDNSWVSDATLKDLTSCAHIHSINLRNCDKITDGGLEYLLQIPSLRSVNLRGCTKITDTGVQILSALSLVEDLDLSFLNQVTDVGLKSMAKNRTLRRLILNWCNLVTSVGLHAIRATCTGLEELSIKGCHSMEYTDLISIANSSNVQKLDYEHTICSIVQSAEKKKQQELPPMRHIDSVGCFLEIC